MMILWVPGHYFLWENERSDEEARRGRSELLREESVNLSLQVRPPHGPRQLARTGRKTGVCGGQILWWGEWDSAAPVGLVLGLHGGEMEGLIRRESLGVGGDAPQGLGATQSYSEVPEVKHNKNCTSKTTSFGPSQYTLPQLLLISCLYLCSTYKCDSICNILSLRALLADQLSAFNASHRVHHKPYDHRLHKGISQSDSIESHSLRQGSSSFCCLPSGLFFSLQLYTY